MRWEDVSEYVLVGYSNFRYSTRKIGNQISAGQLDFSRVPGGAGRAQDYRRVISFNLCANLT